MEKMFIEALAELKGGKKKLRELLDTVLEEYEQAQQMREVWATKAETALEAKMLIESKLGLRDFEPKGMLPPDEEPKDSIGE